MACEEGFLGASLFLSWCLTIWQESLRGGIWKNLLQTLFGRNLRTSVCSEHWGWSQSRFLTSSVSLCPASCWSSSYPGWSSFWFLLTCFHQNWNWISGSVSSPAFACLHLVIVVLSICSLIISEKHCDIVKYWHRIHDTAIFGHGELRASVHLHDIPPGLWESWLRWEAVARETDNMQHCSTVCCRLKSAALTIERMQVSGRLGIQDGGVPGNHFHSTKRFLQDVKVLKITDWHWQEDKVIPSLMFSRYISHCMSLDCLCCFTSSVQNIRHKSRTDSDRDQLSSHHVLTSRRSWSRQYPTLNKSQSISRRVVKTYTKSIFHKLGSRILCLMSGVSR